MDVVAFGWRELLSLKLPERPYLIPHLLYEGSHFVLGGSAKRGKSFIFHGILCSLATGNPLFGNAEFCPPAPSPGILFSQELGPQELQRRWAKYHGVLSAASEARLAENLVIVPRHTALRLDRPGGPVELIAIAEQVARRWGRNPAWIALDPLAKFHLLDENRQQDCAIVSNNMRVLQERFGNPAILFVHHHGHPTETKLLLRHGGGMLRGSTFLYGDVDTIMSLHRLSGLRARSPRFRVDWETRHGQPPASWHIHLDAESVIPYFDSYAVESDTGPADHDASDLNTPQRL